MNRREFLSKGLKAGLTAGLTFGLGGLDKILAAGGDAPGLVAVKGNSISEMFDAGIKAMGGMKNFVKKGQTVLVKPNIGWDVTPEFAANTNPDLVAAVIKSCYAAGAGKVHVFDHTCDSWKDTYASSGIEKAAKKAGAFVSPGNAREYYKTVSVPGGVALTSANVHELLLKSDVFINVPVLKSHGSSKLTIGMKNLMGVVWDRGTWHATNLHQCIADFAAYRKPDLTIVDCFRVMTQNGPRGINSSEDVAQLNSMIFSRDPVAADAAAAKLFGVEPSSVKYIKLAHEKGIGNMNLDEVKIKKVYM
jgi:uncharacterized protein (DUF362 family)